MQKTWLASAAVLTWAAPTWSARQIAYAFMLASVGPGTQTRLLPDSAHSRATTGKLSTHEAAVRTTQRGRPEVPEVASRIVSPAAYAARSAAGEITLGSTAAGAGSWSSDRRELRAGSSPGSAWCTPRATNAATTALARSPGRNTAEITVAPASDSCPMTDRPTIPKAYSTTIPPSTLIAISLPSDPAASNRSVSQPITKAANGNPIRNPALGVKKTPSPPRPPASSGSPRATSSRNTRTAAVPRHRPSTEPASITPSDCRVIGTATPGMTIPGTRPNAAMTPTKTAIRARPVAENSRVGVTLGIVRHHPRLTGRTSPRDRDVRAPAVMGV